MFTAPRVMINPQTVFQRLTAALEKSWDRETAYPPCQADWSEDNPAYGNCWVTTLVVWHQLRRQQNETPQVVTGDVFEPDQDPARDEGAWHFQLSWEGHRIDLTWQQFEEGAQFLETPYGSATYRLRIRGAIDGDKTLVPRLNRLLDNLRTKGDYAVEDTAEDIVREFKAANPEVYPAARVRRRGLLPGVASRNG